jgi:hypothetical protein
MPYIDAEGRNRIAVEGEPRTPGELNYLFSILAKDYLDRKGLNYTHLNDVIGVLECCKQELYRRIAVPYENAKMAENGDVF